MQVIVTKNCEVVKRFTSDRMDEIIKEYKRITRNAWRRKYTFCEVEYPLDMRMSWNELGHKGEDTPSTGYNRFYVHVQL